MDVSDGLAGDLAKLCAASGVSAVIEARHIPISAAATAALATVGFEKLVSGGDDYEVLCAVPEARCAEFGREAERVGIAVTTIGTITAGSESPRWVDAQGSPIALRRLSYSHF